MFGMFTLTKIPYNICFAVVSVALSKRIIILKLVYIDNVSIVIFVDAVTLLCYVSMHQHYSCNYVVEVTANTKPNSLLLRF